LCLRSRVVPLLLCVRAATRGKTKRTTQKAAWYRAPGSVLHLFLFRLQGVCAADFCLPVHAHDSPFVWSFAPSLFPCFCGCCLLLVPLQGACGLLHSYIAIRKVFCIFVQLRIVLFL
jgi:hypothetical protein